MNTNRYLAILVSGLALLLILSSVLLPMVSVGATPPESEKGSSRTPNPPSDGSITVDDVILARPQSPAPLAPMAPAAAIMNEGFEGTWPAPGWEISDQSSGDGGEYLWGKRNCHPHTGNFGGWSVGGGTQGSALPCSADYPNNTNTWAVYGPFDLSNATAASLTFHFWGRTEGATGCPFDFFFVGSSINNVDFSGSFYCGDWTNGTAGNGYHRRTLDLSSRLGQSQVWVAFVLSSDGSITDSGITIDDVTLDVTSAGAIPSPPGNLTALALSQMQILLQWTDNSNNETGFKIEQSLNGVSGWTQIATTPANVTSHAPPGLNCGTTYHYRVRAYNASGNSPYSNTASATTLACPTDTPTPTPAPVPPAALLYLPYVAKSLPPTATPTVTPTPASELDGTWVGTTSQGVEISFTIVNRSFTRFTSGYQIGGCGATVTTNFGTPQEITGNTFVITQGGGFVATVNTNGTFNSDTSASGTLTVTGTPCGNATATWTATKQ
ncbi:MAG: fibronectin type III domain-containing protein [Anaerolineae bacterium]